MSTYRRIASLKTATDFGAYLAEVGADIPFDEILCNGDTSPLAQPYTVDGFTVGNRFCILPMEGWDGTPDGYPTDLTMRRWQRFGLSGAKLIWGGEAAAVRHDGRANPNQLMLDEHTLGSIAALRETLVKAHVERHRSADDLLVGLQLTHSGRFARPNHKNRLEPRTLYRHPLLDRKSGITDDSTLLGDGEIARLVDDFVRTAQLAWQAGFGFVDVKHCHGYLGHEFLSAVTRPGPYGGSFENRTRFLREVVAGIRAATTGLMIGVRFSAFDFVPFRPGDDGTGVPESIEGSYPYAFGGDGSGQGIDLTEPICLVDLLHQLGVHLICVTGGSPYYNPHIQRPALFPPSDGYRPPEDPLIGVARQMAVTARLKRHRPELMVVGSAYSYLQEWLPNVAQAVVRRGMADAIGLGRAILPYPELPTDVLAGRCLQRRLICRTFSDCTTAPRKGLVSGCYPLDAFYKSRQEANIVKGRL